MTHDDVNSINPEQGAKNFSIQTRLNLFFHAVLFVIGFSLIFIIVFGGAATLLSGLLVQLKPILTRIGGIVLILFGLATMEVIHLPFFYMDTRKEYQGRTGTYIGSFLMGIFFAAGWSPCIGATLGAIITLGFSGNSNGLAMLLAASYSLGLGIPFLLMALLLNQAAPLMKRISKHLRTFQIISGILIILIGILLISNRFTMLANWALQSGLYLDVPGSNVGVPGLFTAFFAGLLSFLSPCVLPLVPAYLGYLSGHLVVSAKIDRNMEKIND